MKRYKADLKDTQNELEKTNKALSHAHEIRFIVSIEHKYKKISDELFLSIMESLDSVTTQLYEYAMEMKDEVKSFRFAIKSISKKHGVPYLDPMDACQINLF